jgi:primosomal protein N''
MISAQALSELMALGIEGERLLAVVAVFERDLAARRALWHVEPRPTKGALRMRRYRERLKIKDLERRSLS